MTTKKTATQIGAEMIGSTGVRQRLYKLSEPLGNADYVIVSAVDLPFSGPETYIFKADADGDVLDWIELDGSFRGALDHDLALKYAGYEVVS